MTELEFHGIKCSVVYSDAPDGGIYADVDIRELKGANDLRLLDEHAKAHGWVAEGFTFDRGLIRSHPPATGEVNVQALRFRHADRSARFPTSFDRP